MLHIYWPPQGTECYIYINCVKVLTVTDTLSAPRYWQLQMLLPSLPPGQDAEWEPIEVWVWGVRQWWQWRRQGGPTGGVLPAPTTSLSGALLAFFCEILSGFQQLKLQSNQYYKWKINLFFFNMQNKIDSSAWSRPAHWPVHFSLHKNFYYRNSPGSTRRDTSNSWKIPKKESRNPIQYKTLLPGNSYSMQRCIFQPVIGYFIP